MSETVSLELLGRQMQQMQADMRSLKRDMAMLRAQQSELPTLAQFQAGLTAIDERVTELVNGISASNERMEATLANIRAMLERH